MQASTGFCELKEFNWKLKQRCVWIGRLSPVAGENSARRIPNRGSELIYHTHKQSTINPTLIERCKLSFYQQWHARLAGSLASAHYRSPVVTWGIRSGVASRCITMTNTTSSGIGYKTHKETLIFKKIYGLCSPRLWPFPKIVTPVRQMTRLCIRSFTFRHKDLPDGSSHVLACCLPPPDRHRQVKEMGDAGTHLPSLQILRQFSLPMTSEQSDPENTKQTPQFRNFCSRAIMTGDKTRDGDISEIRRFVIG